MTPKQAALIDYQAGDWNPVAPSNFTHNEKAEYYKQFKLLIEAEGRENNG